MAASITSPTTIAGDAASEEAVRDAIGAALVAGEAIDITVNDGADTITVLCEDASETNKGVVELATLAETDTGTDAARPVCPDQLAGSIFGIKEISVEVFPAGTAWTTGDGKAYFRVPPSLNGMNLVGVPGVGVIAKSTSGMPTLQLARGRQASATDAHTFADMLSTLITVDANDFDSKDATTPPVINGSNDDVLTGDLIRVDCDVAGTGTTGGFLTLQFQLP